MRTIYADAGYSIALLNADDNGYDRVIAASSQLGSFRILTSEIVIIEVLNYFAGYGRNFRAAAVSLVLDIYADPLTMAPATRISPS